jgi:hypothetical protein
MARYLVIHSPTDTESGEDRPPTRLVELARAHVGEDARPRWLRAWSPDVHDERLFTLWDATSAEEILKTIRTFGFLDHMEPQAINVREWGPDDVLAAESDE